MTGHQWGYGEEDGPSAWSREYPIAEGNRQSPIDIVPTETVYDPKLPPITLSYDLCASISISNNGHSVVVEFDDVDNKAAMDGCTEVVTLICMCWQRQSRRQEELKPQHQMALCLGGRRGALLKKKGAVPPKQQLKLVLMKYEGVVKAALTYGRVHLEGLEGSRQVIMGGGSVNA
ncbi:hypothetical protein SKAU_G00345390 [Synaphobranchus kaupii]|uniref:Alpha-carbonic anhydrase domain-containing protein n=1 Tax=Synaphobranchus kaupii TaxID=118154 RepID=A0A9Q1EJD3_SYNKA|nr:hypothetical protein SKAU_G00345390 [Synaphobranchus kaupii]